MNKMKCVTRKAKFKGYEEDSIYVEWESVFAHPERVSALRSQNGNAYEEGHGDAWDPIRVFGRIQAKRTARLCATLRSRQKEDAPAVLTGWVLAQMRCASEFRLLLERILFRKRRDGGRNMLEMLEATMQKRCALRVRRDDTFLITGVSSRA